MRSASPVVLTVPARLKGGFVGLGGCFHPYASDLADGIYIEQGEVNPLIPPNPPCALDAGGLQVPASDARHPTQAKGVLPGRIAMRGARAQHFATVRPENKVCRVCGSQPAARTSRPNAPSARACARRWGNGEGANLGAYSVCRFAPQPRENGQDRKLNAGAGLQPIRWLGCRNRPTSLCARSDASDTSCRNFP